MRGRPIKITKKQTQLTPAQERFAKKFAKHQIEKYLSTKQYVDDKTIELYVRNAYKAGGLSAPKKIVWVDSPYAFAEKYCRSVESSVESSVWSSVWGLVESSVWSSVRSSVWSSVWSSVESLVRSSVRSSVESSVESSVWSSVWSSVRSSVESSVWSSVRSSVWSWDLSGGYSFYKFFNDYFKKNDLIWLSLISENTVGYGLFKDECWLVRKPKNIFFNKKQQLHSEQGKAIEFRDGKGLYAFNGVVVPEKVIMEAEKLGKKDWIGEENLEVRRVIQEQMGSEFVEKIGGKMIHKGNRGKLYQVDLKEDPEKVAKYVRVKDTSTKREYYLRVPPSVVNADEGIAWTFGLTDIDYKPLQEA